MNRLSMGAACVLCASIATVASGDADPHLTVGDETFKVVATIPVPDNPHGTCFSPDGNLAYVACSGADSVVLIDTRTYEIVRTIDGGSVPLDVMLSPDGQSLIATQFQSDSLVRIALDGSGIEPISTLKKGPSLFTPFEQDSKRYVVCEFDDVVFEVDPLGTILRSWETGDRPYPCAIGPDGGVLYVPCRDEGVVSIIDTLNELDLGKVAVGANPEGGAVTPDNAHYIVTCGASNELYWINTATKQVDARLSRGIGPRPFSVAITSDGKWGVVNNAGGNTLSIVDLDTRTTAGQIEVGATPIVVRAHPDGKRFFVSCEGDHVVSVVERSNTAKRSDAKTQVLVMGMIHSGHRTSERYSLDVVRQLIREIDPDDVCVEIPPSRLAAALREYTETGEVTESRVRVFPEYVDVLLPLTKEMDFTIVATAGWTKEMNDYRRAQMGSIREDPARAEQWGEHEAAMEALDEEMASLGESDDPRMIHSDAYDRAIAKGYGGPYNEYFNDDLGPGGWDNINALHYGNIARHLDRVRGQGRRVLVTYGAAHKGWFLHELRKREDVELLELGPMLDAIGR